MKMPLCIKKPKREVKKSMNLFKKHYKTARNELWNYESPQTKEPDGINALEGKLNSLKWNMVISVTIPLSCLQRHKFVIKKLPFLVYCGMLFLPVTGRSIFLMFKTLFFVLLFFTLIFPIYLFSCKSKRGS